MIMPFSNPRKLSLASPFEDKQEEANADLGNASGILWAESSVWDARCTGC